jgi:mRNA interferase MazF
MLSRGEIVLIPVPFTDLTSARRRPVIVISNDQYNSSLEDIIVVAMTSNPHSTRYSFVVTSTDLVAGTLNRPGRVRVDNIYTLSQRIVVRRFGRVSDPILDRIRQMLLDLCNP